MMSHTSDARLAAIMAIFVACWFVFIVWTNIWLGLLSYHAFCFGIPFLFGYDFRKAGLQAPSWRQAASSILVGLLILTAALIAEPVGKRLFLASGGGRLFLDLSPVLQFCLYSLLVNPFAEEWFWRGFGLQIWGDRKSALLFGMVHTIGLSFYLPLLPAACLGAGAVFIGMLWGWLRQTANNLWPCVITHVAADAAILLIIFS